MFVSFEFMTFYGKEAHVIIMLGVYDFERMTSDFGASDWTFPVERHR